VDVDDEDEEEIYSHFKTVVAAVLLVFNPLSVRALSDLLRVSNISTTLHSLHSLLLVPDQRRQKLQFKPSTSHSLTSSQTQRDAKANGFLWNLQFIIQKSYFHAST
jgi:hypothetical protein